MTQRGGCAERRPRDRSVEKRASNTALDRGDQVQVEPTQKPSDAHAPLTQRDSRQQPEKQPERDDHPKQNAANSQENQCPDESACHTTCLWVRAHRPIIRLGGWEPALFPRSGLTPDHWPT